MSRGRSFFITTDPFGRRLPEDEIVPIVKRELKLYPHQQDPHQQALEILQHNMFVNNISEMGTGKTPLTISIAMSLGLPFFVIGPSRDPWDEFTSQYHTTQFLGYITYNKLQIGGPIPDLGNISIVTTQTFQAEGGNKFVRYSFTPEWKALCQRGILLVFDEAHALKNDTKTTRAATALTAAIRGTRSRATFLTATFIDQKEVRSYYRAFGVLTAEELGRSDPSSGSYVPDGANEIFQYCARLNKQSTMEVANKLGGVINSSNVKEFIEELFFDVVLPNTTVEIPNVMIGRRCYRGFFQIANPEDSHKVNQGIDHLVNAVTKGGPTGRIDYGDITNALREIEVAEVNDFCRLALRDLAINRKAKVILGFNYHESIDKARRIFSMHGYHVAEFHGGITPLSARMKEKDDFQHDPNVRVMLIINATGGVAVSFTDEKGDEPRTMYISPDYRMIIIHQATGRIFRSNQKSVGRAFIFYSLTRSIMDVIINSLAKKSKFMRRTLTSNNRGSIFPGEYPRYVEGYTGPDGKGTGFIDEDAVRNMQEDGRLPRPQVENENDKTIQTEDHTSIITRILDGHRDIPTYDPPVPPIKLRDFTDQGGVDLPVVPIMDAYSGAVVPTAVGASSAPSPFRVSQPLISGAGGGLFSSFLSGPSAVITDAVPPSFSIGNMAPIPMSTDLPPRYTVLTDVVPTPYSSRSPINALPQLFASGTAVQMAPQQPAVPPPFRLSLAPMASGSSTSSVSSLAPPHLFTPVASGSSASSVSSLAPPPLFTPIASGPSVPPPLFTPVASGPSAPPPLFTPVASGPSAPPPLFTPVASGSSTPSVPPPLFTPIASGSSAPSVPPPLFTPIASGSSAPSVPPPFFTPVSRPSLPPPTSLPLGIQSVPYIPISAQSRPVAPPPSAVVLQGLFNTVPSQPCKTRKDCNDKNTFYLD